ncbi:sigma-70 family RNA polymerase sigma factor [Phytoactinopolyspora halotolerans]|uniref:Sigma-70 family RNA polymerase sigma factor n=1 Tax=Phytoactinopolyspora halotolerans TaxID=1981512 RepID=A0A6L9SBF0_9ACTN|nr:sigma-70 family RNA polymerase sigma factor [Phytoactinopolyspora halotolerans]
MHAEDLLRRAAPQVLAALVRRYGNFETAEDAVQEALLAAATQWPEQGLPDDPPAWLVTVASRRMTDLLRKEAADRRRDERSVTLVPDDALVAPAAETEMLDGGDDTLTLLLLCCHPCLTAPSQVALTLRAVGGLTTAEIAHAFLVPEATMAQRISRAKQRIRAGGARFTMPATPDPERLRSVLHVLYLIFNEGYTSSSGPHLQRTDLTQEAIRITRTVHHLLPHDGEAAGLLALMLLIDARRGARTGPDGGLVPLAEQDRSRWDQRSIKEGVDLITDALARSPIGPYQVQASIAALHAEAERAQDTDWPQILHLYRMLQDLAPGPMVTLNHAVALAMAHGPRAGLMFLEPLEHDARLSRHHRLHAVRAHLLEMAGQTDDARACYTLAARLTTSVPEQAYLRGRASRLDMNTL